MCIFYFICKMTLEEARAAHKVFFSQRSRIQKSVFIERYNEWVDLHKLIHTPAMFNVRNWKEKKLNTKQRKLKNALAAIWILQFFTTMQLKHLLDHQKINDTLVDYYYEEVGSIKQYVVRIDKVVHTSEKPISKEEIRQIIIANQ